MESNKLLYRVQKVFDYYGPNSINQADATVFASLEHWFMRYGDGPTNDSYQSVYLGADDLPYIVQQWFVDQGCQPDEHVLVLVSW